MCESNTRILHTPVLVPVESIGIEGSASTELSAALVWLDAFVYNPMVMLALLEGGQILLLRFENV
jgi:hypothetical protein